MLNQLTTGVITADPAGRIRSLNPAAENLLSTGARNALGRPIDQLVPGLEPLGELLARASGQQQTFSIELKIPAPRRDGGDLDLMVRISPADVAGEELLIIELVDSTQRHHLDRESALLNQHGVSRRMLRQLAHEIRNPLGGLRGAAQLLERELPAGSELTDFTQVIVNEADRLASLVDTLLGPVGPADMQAGTIHEVLEHVATLVTSALPALDLVRDYDPSLPAVLMDKNQLNQAMLNLTNNAAQAVDGKGRVVIRTRIRNHVMLHQQMHRNVVSIEIEDNGPGVPADIAETLFYPLVTGRTEGTGLGLPLAQDLVNRHGGLIEYDSLPGHTVFTVLLPIAGVD